MWNSLDRIPDYPTWVYKPSSKTSFRMFRNDWLEMFSKSSPIHLLIWVPILLYCTLKGNMFRYQFSVGLIFWTLFEYSFHRFIFHRLTNLPKIHFLLHGQHHKFPLDKSRHLFPPIPALIGVFFIWQFLLFLSANPYSYLTGFLTGYLLYDIIHYYAHKNRSVHHFQHHFKNNNRNFGISSSFWDICFNTLL